VQYIQPHHAAQRLGQAELLVIDEAAAIPLPMVKAMLGPYLVFMCSTGKCWGGGGQRGVGCNVDHAGALHRFHVLNRCVLL
jgi:tRNA(Met) C34 N-acetyltransferase TmcA